MRSVQRDVLPATAGVVFTACDEPLQPRSLTGPCQDKFGVIQTAGLHFPALPGAVAESLPTGESRRRAGLGMIDAANGPLDPGYAAGMSELKQAAILGDYEASVKLADIYHDVPELRDPTRAARYALASVDIWDPRNIRGDIPFDGAGKYAFEAGDYKSAQRYLLTSRSKESYLMLSYLLCKLDFDDSFPAPPMSSLDDWRTRATSSGIDVSAGYACAAEWHRVREAASEAAAEEGRRLAAETRRRNAQALTAALVGVVQLYADKPQSRAAAIRPTGSSATSREQMVHLDPIEGLGIDPGGDPAAANAYRTQCAGRVVSRNGNEFATCEGYTRAMFNANAQRSALRQQEVLDGQAAQQRRLAEQQQLAQAQAQAKQQSALEARQRAQQQQSQIAAQRRARPQQQAALQSPTIIAPASAACISYGLQGDETKEPVFSVRNSCESTIRWNFCYRNGGAPMSGTGFTDPTMSSTYRIFNPDAKKIGWGFRWCSGSTCTAPSAC